jgi:hypothetical protein
MAGFSTDTIDNLIRANIWENDLKEVFLPELMGLKYVDMISFPDGDTWNLPSIGQMETQDYAEGQAVRYTAMDTGNFTFTITDYKSSATYVTNKMKQDSLWMDRIVASFVPKMNRALMTDIETAILDLAPNAQTASDSNTINGGKHRFVASGTSQKITFEDFAKAKYALQKAYVPMTNLVAIVDPSVEHELSTQANITSLMTPNPTWGPVITNGLSTGMRFITNIYGFDVYTSDYLKQGISETIDSVAVTNGVANLFFSAAGDALPFMGSLRQPPKVDTSYNKDLQRDEYVTTARWGFKLYRPESVVVILSDNSQVYA